MDQVWLVRKGKKYLRTPVGNIASFSSEKAVQDYLGRMEVNMADLHILAISKDMAEILAKNSQSQLAVNVRFPPEPTPPWTKEEKMRMRNAHQWR